MKNLLSLLAALGLTATAATTVIACGSPKNSVVIKKIALKDLNLKTRLKNSVKNQQAAFDSFIELNPEVSDLRDSVQVIDFTVPDYNQEGLLEVQAKTNTNYSGTLTITIPELNKTDLARLVTNTTIQGVANMTVAEAFQAVLTANSSWTNLSDYVDYDVDSFVPSSATTPGSLTIIAKANSEYSGSLTISISKLIALNTLNLTAIAGTESMNNTDAFNAFLGNQDQNLLDDFATKVTYALVKPGYATSGSLTITAKPNTEYTGSVEIIINAIGQMNLSGLTDIVREVASTTTRDNALQAFLAANQTTYPDLTGNITFDENSFVESTYSSVGSYTISATRDGKYSGSVEVTIPLKVKVELDSVITTTEITGNINQDQVIETVLAANPNSGVTALDLEVTDFVAPTVGETGSALIKAVDASGFIGSVKITITLVPIDAELTEIINKIKATPPKTLAAIEVWKEYFAYYSQARIQYMVDLIKTKYTVNKNDSEVTKKLNLLTQLKNNVSSLLHQVIVLKDGLENIRYDDFNIASNAEIVSFDETNNVISFDMPLNFIWYAKNDIESTTTLTETRTITINFQQV